MVSPKYDGLSTKSSGIEDPVSFDMSGIVQALSKAMASHGFDVPAPIVDGKFHRFSTGDGKRNSNGWYRGHSDGIPMAVYGDWVSGDPYKWRAKEKTSMTPHELSAYNERMASIKAERERIQADEYKAAAIRASKIWEEAEPATDDHGYLKKKGVLSFGLKQKDGRLLIPVFNAEEDLQSLQQIGVNGFKGFLKNGKLAGGFYCIDGHDDRVAIAEGYATAASINQATGNSVYIAFNAGNLLAVARIVKTRHPGAQIIIAADSDQWTKGNPGLNKGREAAEAIGAYLAIPIFKDTSSKPTDWNDLAALEGLPEVKRQIEEATTARQNEKPSCKYITGKELMRREFKEPAWFLEGYLPKGLLILGGKPKAGKSLLVGNLVISVATGGRFFNVKADEPQTVLLLGLEDTFRRLQDRFRKMTLDNGVDLTRLVIFNEFAKADKGGLRDLEEMILLHKPALIVIDTLKKFKSSSNGKKQLYDENYESVDEIKRIADLHGITIILVHHLRKMESEDPFDGFSGSLGLTAAADSLWVMHKQQGGMVLSMTGRDMEPCEKAVKLHPASLTWHIIGDASEVQTSRQQQDIYDCLKQSKVPLKPKSVHAMTDGISYDVVRKTLKKLFNANRINMDDQGMYSVPVSLIKEEENFEV